MNEEGDKDCICLLYTNNKQEQEQEQEQNMARECQQIKRTFPSKWNIEGSVHENRLRKTFIQCHPRQFNLEEVWIWNFQGNWKSTAWSHSGCFVSFCCVCVAYKVIYVTQWYWAPSLMLLWHSNWPTDRVWRVWESRWRAIFIRKSCPKHTRRFQNIPGTPIRSVRLRLLFKFQCHLNVILIKKTDTKYSRA